MMDVRKMRMVLVAGMLMALFLAVLTAVNGECPSLSSGVAGTRLVEGAGAG
jgi:hypothetical protein